MSKVKIIGLTPQDFQVIVQFLSGLNVPFNVSDEAARALAAIKNAKDFEVDNISNNEKKEG